MSAQTNVRESRRGSKAASCAGRAVGAIALIVLAACSKESQQLTNPSPPAPRFFWGGHGGGVGGCGGAALGAAACVGAGSFHHEIYVCVEPSSPLGTYAFVVTPNTTQNGMLELATDFDFNFQANGINIDQNSLGPFGFVSGVNNDVITSPVPIPRGACARVFVRATTCPGPICNVDDPYSYAGNRVWTFHDPDFELNPYATVDIIPTVPAGYTFSVSCQNDDPTLPQTAGCSTNPPIVANTIFSSANVVDGSIVTYKFYAPADVCPTVSISSNFNGTAIPAGRTIWFNSRVKVDGPVVDGTTITLSESHVDFTGGGPFLVPIPDAVITFSSAALIATTALVGGQWETTVPLSYNKEIFLSGLPFLSPGLPGGINPVVWAGAITSNTPGVKAKWQWSAAVYTSFGAMSALGVKPTEGNNTSIYSNSDHAGTPENFKSFVTGGARGGGGSNATGGWSSSGKACL